MTITFPEETTHVFDPKVDLKTLRTEAALLQPEFMIHGNRWSIVRDEHYKKLDEILSSIPRGKTLAFSCNSDLYRKPEEFSKNIDGSWASGYGLQENNWNVINVMFHNACGKPLPNLKITGKAYELILDGEVHPCLPSKNPKLKRIGLDMDQLKFLPAGSAAEFEKTVLVKQPSGKWLLWDKITAMTVGYTAGNEFLEFNLRSGLYGLYVPI